MKKLVKRIIKKISGILLILVAITIWIIHTYEIENPSMQTSSGVLSGTKIGWGIKRAKDHAQPDVGKVNKELMDKYNRNLHGKQRQKIHIPNLRRRF